MQAQLLSVKKTAYWRFQFDSCEKGFEKLLTVVFRKWDRKLNIEGWRGIKYFLEYSWTGYIREQTGCLSSEGVLEENQLAVLFSLKNFLCFSFVNKLYVNFKKSKYLMFYQHFHSGTSEQDLLNTFPLGKGIGLDNVKSGPFLFAYLKN